MIYMILIYIKICKHISLHKDYVYNVYYEYIYQNRYHRLN